MWTPKVGDGGLSAWPAARDAHATAYAAVAAANIKLEIRFIEGHSRLRSRPAIGSYFTEENEVGSSSWLLVSCQSGPSSRSRRRSQAIRDTRETLPTASRLLMIAAAPIVPRLEAR